MSRWAPTTTRPQVGFDGKKAVYIGIQVAPAANLLDVIKGVRAVFPGDRRRSCRRASTARSSTTPPSS